jgi:hypothetical protein
MLDFINFDGSELVAWVPSLPNLSGGSKAGRFISVLYSVLALSPEFQQVEFLRGNETFVFPQDLGCFSFLWEARV